MGWAILIAMAVLCLLALRWLGGLRGTPLGLLGAAMLAGIAGYAWQGRPDLPGTAKPAPIEQRQPDSSFAVEREALLERFGSDAQILTAADAMHREGLDAYSVGLIRGGLEKNPNSADLWVGLGNALTLYAGGLVTPAADFAFARGAQIAPDHPGPAYFRGLAFLQQGDPDRALVIWEDLLARSPADASWRQDISARVEALKQAMRE
jgi:cytochrome c-type biogenesis protein CcmH